MARSTIVFIAVLILAGFVLTSWTLYQAHKNHRAVKTKEMKRITWAFEVRQILLWVIMLTASVITLEAIFQLMSEATRQLVSRWGIVLILLAIDAVAVHEWNYMRHLMSKRFRE